AALAAATLAAAPGAALAQTTPPATPVGEVIVTASRLNLLGQAMTASQGAVTRQEVELRPIYRVGQLYETVPGLVVTVHSGESKAPQYELRGFDLDHGTDFASFIDGMPVNQGTNLHGQGYSDQSYLMPQTVAGLDYTKGPYYAGLGDFGAVGSARVRLLDVLPNQVSASAGTLGDDDVFIGGTHVFGGQTRLWAAAEVAHVDGPWSPPSNYNKQNFAARFSHGEAADGYSLTAMYNSSGGRLETDQPLRAIQQGLIGRFGVLDPTDRGRTERYSFSGHYAAQGEAWQFTSDLYGIHTRERLINDFTHFLDDPVNGDQERQDETRDVLGGDAALTVRFDVGAVRTETQFGVQDRFDSVFVDRRHTLRDQTLDYCMVEGPFPPGETPPPPPADAPASDNATAVPAIGGACNADRVHLNDFGAYVQTTTYWTGWLRTVVGFREEAFYADDHSFTTGFRGHTSEALPQPKGSLVLGPWLKTELYLSAGRGFHSDDVRGVFGTVPIEGFPVLAGPTPLLAPTTGEEVGLRSNLIPKVAVQVALFREDFSSELAFDEDQGQDEATAPSRRQGVEVSAQYRPLPWIELNTDLAFSHARYVGSPEQLANFELDGPFIANAPSFIGSFGVLVDNLGPWFGALQWRKLGAYPVSDGDALPRDPGYSEVNLDVGYRLSPRLKLTASVFNLFNTHANAAAFYYASRLPGEPAEGVTDFQVHPLEPLSVRFSVTASF
ncbi:MAG TPA: TonB-dependent receptor, partial [Caulobacteraceae bacterium]|nr:TonB-dependent receptor [Caulobacteraceae bacterium]